MAHAGRELAAHLALRERPSRRLRWVVPGDIRVRAAEAAALEAIVPPTRPGVASPAVWAERTAAAPSAIRVYAAVGGALLGAAAAVGGGVVGALLGAGLGGVLAGSLLGSVLTFSFADRVGLAADRAASAAGGGVGLRRRASAAGFAGVSASWTVGAPAGMVAGAIVGYRTGIPLGKDPEALGLIVGCWAGMIGAPPVAALAGALLGGLVGATGAAVEALQRALSRSVAHASLGVTAVAGALALALGAPAGVAVAAAVGTIGGSLVGVLARGRARWTAVWASASPSEAFLWLFWRCDGGFVAASQPALQLSEGALHAENGPAVCWPWGARAWHWRGVPVPGRVVERPEALSAHEIRAERDPDVRLVMIERFGGVDRYMREMRANLLQQDDFGRLWEGPFLPTDASGIRTMVAVEVRDATGGAVSLLRVPPGIRTAREGVAWTFGFDDPQAYHPELET